jgi:hypothetical protein
MENPTATNIALGEENLLWNEFVPGLWSRLYRLDQVGSYVARRCKAKSGVYRLVGLAEPGINAPATFDRICGRDQTGTLYIGCAGRRSTLPTRLQQLVRTLSDRGRRRNNSEHSAGDLLLHKLLSQQFPPNNLAVSWSYHTDAFIAENDLLRSYIRSFGEAPPLNRQHGIG